MYLKNKLKIATEKSFHNAYKHTIFLRKHKITNQQYNDQIYKLKVEITNRIKGVSMLETISSVSIPKRKDETHKGDYGKILLIGGNANLGGAIMLAARACVYSGSGLITVATHPTNHAALHSRCPEAMVIDINDTKMLTKMIENTDCILIGPGLGCDFKGNNAITFLLQNIQPHQTLIVDGDAITIFSKLKPDIPTCNVIFTPHQKEWERLSGIAIEEQTYERNREAADRIGATIVLKCMALKSISKMRITNCQSARLRWQQVAWGYTCWYDYKFCRSIRRHERSGYECHLYT